MLNPVASGYRVSVIGAGKMGLPIACLLAENGAKVIAVDKNAQLVEQINRAQPPFQEPELEEKLQAGITTGRLTATTDAPKAIADSNVIIVIVPVLLTKAKHADLTVISSVAQQIGKSLQPGSMVVFETTLPVGESRKLHQQISQISGLLPGKDYYAAFSPERVKSLHVFRNLRLVPKIVGGFTPECSQRAETFYSAALGAPTINLQSLEAAEYAKLADMIYRDVNIALANELSSYAEKVGVDFEAIRVAANTSGESHLLMPGIGVGGHCTPIYPWFVINDAHMKLGSTLLPLEARVINDARAKYAFDRIKEVLDSKLSNYRVLILGLGFRPEVAEATASPAYLVRDVFEKAQNEVLLHDPYFTPEQIRNEGFTFFDWDAPKVESIHIVILVTAHQPYLKRDWESFVQRHKVAVVYDGRNALNAHQIEQAGAIYLGVGKPYPLRSA
jgi:nucleotide sugar dehydrogenase